MNSKEEAQCCISCGEELTEAELREADDDDDADIVCYLCQKGNRETK